MKKFVLVFSLVLLSVLSKTQTLPAGFIVTNATTSVNWVQPVGAMFSKSGDKLFVWEKAGKVFVCNKNVAGDYVKQSTPC